VAVLRAEKAIQLQVGALVLNVLLAQYIYPGQGGQQINVLDEIE